MGSDDIFLTDDYVAELLAKDAKESSIKYSTMGLSAYTSSSKQPANKPKPNTRFLRNIIKETDSHNAALLAKEAAEARVRLRDLPSTETQRPKIAGGDIRRRQLGDIAAILGGKFNKRRKTEEKTKRHPDGRRVNTSSEDEAKPEEDRRSRERNSGRREDREDSHRSRSHRERPREKDWPLDLSKQIEARRRRDRSRSRSPRERSSKESRRHRERSPRRRRSRSPEVRGKSHRSRRDRSSTPIRKNERLIPSDPVKKPSKDIDPKIDYDSDPLDDIIGPRPPPIPEIRTRGRGTISTASGIDSRFSANYDPTADVQLDAAEEDDWEEALEALRDRQKWQKQGADRLKAAGFTDEQVRKWEKGGEKREEDVRWAKRGEGREWDRGKVVDEDGDVEVGVESESGRLKDA